MADETALRQSLGRIADAFAQEPPDPIAGHVWRCRWQDAAQLVVVVSVNDRSVDAIPMTSDVDLGDDTGVTFSTAGGTLENRWLAWVGLRQSLPTRVLDICVDRVEPATLEAFRVEVGDGAPIGHPLDERLQVRDAIAARMHALKAARWERDDVRPVDIEALIKARGLSAGQVAQQADVPPGTIVEILRHRRVPTGNLADRLGEILDVSPSELSAQPLDANLVVALDRPKYRRRLADKGRQAGVLDEGAWRYQVANEQLALAARTTVHADEMRRWQGVIEDYLGST